MAFHCQKTSFMTNWRQQSTIQCVFPTLFCIRKGFILQARRNYTNILKLTQKLLPVAYKYIIWFWGSQVLPLPAQELTLCQQTTVSPLYVISWRAFRHAISLSARSLQTKHPNIHCCNRLASRPRGAVWRDRNKQLHVVLFCCTETMTLRLQWFTPGKRLSCPGDKS